MIRLTVPALRPAAVGGGLLIALATVLPAMAAQVDIGKLEHQLMNPCENCGGKPLAGSYCGPATRAKDEIRTMVDQGMTEPEIVDAFVAEYGEWILAVPDREGFNLLAWIFPVVGMVLGGGGLALFLRRTNGARQRSRADHSEEVEGSVEAAEPDPVSVSGPGVPGSAAPGDGLAALRERLAREVAGN